MAGINGTINWQIQPVDFNSSNLAGSFWNFRANHLKSVNDPLRYQVLWSSSGVTEGTEPSAANFSGLPFTSKNIYGGGGAAWPNSVGFYGSTTYLQLRIDANSKQFSFYFLI